MTNLSLIFYNDILNEICKYLSLKDIFNLQRTNKIMYKNVLSLQNIIMIKELKQFHYETKDVNILKSNAYRHLVYYLDSTYLKDIKRTNCDFKFLKNKALASIFNKIYAYYIKDLQINGIFIKGADLEKYPNKLEIVILYNFINMECFANLYNIDYCFKFVNDLYTKKEIIHESFYDLKLKYYNYILDVDRYHSNYIKLSFNQLYQMLPYLTSIAILKKLFGFKVIDLTYTKLFLCCETCVIDNLHYIARLKMNMYKDDLLCYNYSEILNFLKRENTSYYNILLEYERILVKPHIYIRNPKTNRNTRINGITFKKLKNDLDEYIYLDKIVNNKRNALIKKFFR